MTADTTNTDRDPEEMGRRKELTRYARGLLTTPTFVVVNGLRRALEDIEKRSRELLAKGTAARFGDKGGDSGEVTRLVERLRETITHYQVSENCFVATGITHTGGQISQQQAIYEQITNLSVRTLRFVFINYADNHPPFHRVFFRYPLETPRGDAILLTLGQGSLAVKNKLDSVMARLVRLCLEDGDDNGLGDENEHDHRAILFK